VSKIAQFTAEAVAEAVEEFSTYMAPRSVVAGGKNGDVTVYGENPNARKPPIINIANEDEEINGLLQELSN
jgi:hypothetical protein